MEIGNAISHGVATGLAIAGLVVLMVHAAHLGQAMRIVTDAIYGSILVLFFLSSTLFHSLIYTRARHVFRVFDHAMIFLLIAASYTPISLVTIGGWQGWTLFGFEWALAIAGVVYKSIWLKQKSVWSTIVYVLMGWVCVTCFPILWPALPHPGFYLLLTGGIIYTLGAGVYLFKISSAHFIWHFFVIAGSACIYFTILLYV
ncbi:hemolysin III family protein [Lactobacillus alvi]|uniref:Hemolysin III family protein n=1 Tax=Limosilactobacillus alvi TaxID=990412 RepID=A0ABS2ENS0_9LACO|nr:hemolysin III family protein [Limosilactobacillus alvi]MBM6753885.1 hemolysin III family protein [Limosilactobacillus alvi]